MKIKPIHLALAGLAYWWWTSRKKEEAIASGARGGGVDPEAVEATEAVPDLDKLKGLGYLPFPQASDQTTRPQGVSTIRSPQSGGASSAARRGAGCGRRARSRGCSVARRRAAPPAPPRCSGGMPA